MGWRGRPPPPHGVPSEGGRTARQKAAGWMEEFGPGLRDRMGLAADTEAARAGTVRQRPEGWYRDEVDERLPAPVTADSPRPHHDRRHPRVLGPDTGRAITNIHA